MARVSLLAEADRNKGNVINRVKPVNKLTFENELKLEHQVRGHSYKLHIIERFELKLQCV